MQPLLKEGTFTYPVRTYIHVGQPNHELIHDILRHSMGQIVRDKVRPISRTFTWLNVLLPLPRHLHRLYWRGVQFWQLPLPICSSSFFLNLNHRLILWLNLHLRLNIDHSLVLHRRLALHPKFQLLGWLWEWKQLRMLYGR